MELHSHSHWVSFSSSLISALALLISSLGFPYTYIAVTLWVDHLAKSYKAVHFCLIRSYYCPLGLHSRSIVIIFEIFFLKFYHLVIYLKFIQVECSGGLLSQMFRKARADPGQIQVPGTQLGSAIWMVANQLVEQKPELQVEIGLKPTHVNISNIQQKEVM